MNWWFYSKNDSLSIVEEVIEGQAGRPGAVSHHRFCRKVLGGPGPSGWSLKEGCSGGGWRGAGTPVLSEATP